VFGVIIQHLSREGQEAAALRHDRGGRQ